MKVVQILPSLVRGDAIGNEALCMDLVLREAGYETCISADYLGPGMEGSVASRAGSLEDIGAGDLVLYHLSIGSRLNKLVAELPHKKIYIYHNITPPQFFAGCNPEMERKARSGLCEIRRMRGTADLVLADSRYNKAHLESLGYDCPMEVLPLLIPWEDYEKEADASILNRYRDGRHNILFAGRIAPNKKQEDLIATYCEFHKKYCPESRLILVGNEAGMESYGRELRQYASALGLSSHEIVFTGHVTFEELLGFYQAADVFLSLSEHEGFGVPLAEAMYFSVPVVAFDAAAVAETLGGSGILLESKEPAYVSRVLRQLQTQPRLRERIVAEQKQRWSEYEKNRIAQRFLAYIGSIANQKAD